MTAIAGKFVGTPERGGKRGETEGHGQEQKTRWLVQAGAAQNPQKSSLVLSGTGPRVLLTAFETIMQWKSVLGFRPKLHGKIAIHKAPAEGGEAASSLAILLLGFHGAGESLLARDLFT